MEVVETLDPKARVIAVSGRLDAQTSPQLEARLQELFTAGEKSLVFDLSGLAYISSAGLRVLLVAAKRLGQGRVVLSGLHGTLREIIEISGFHAIFPLAATTKEALAML